MKIKEILKKNKIIKNQIIMQEIIKLCKYLVDHKQEINLLNKCSKGGGKIIEFKSREILIRFLLYIEIY